MQNNWHVRHTDAHTKHKLTGTFPVNIRPEHKMVQEAYITTQTQKRKHEAKDRGRQNDPTRNNVAPYYKIPNQKKRISALQSQGVKDLLIEKVYVIMLFSI